MKDTELMETGIEAEAQAAGEAGPTGETFAIDSEERADWLLRKLANIEAEKARVKAQADKRAKELAADAAGLLARFGEELKAWARGEADRRRRQTVTLMNGALAFESRAARLVIADPQDALTTAKAVCPEAVTVETQTIEHFDSKAFLRYAEAKMLENDGELLPGVDREPAGEAFFIRPAKAGKGGSEE